MREFKFLLELDEEQVEFVATALLLRIDEIMTIPKENRTERTNAELEIIMEVKDALDDMEFEREVAVGFESIMAGVRELLRPPEQI
jgi:hypothetical protein